MRAWVVDHGPCPYLAGRRFRSLVVDQGLRDHYREWMDIGLRRSGSVAYLPHCDGCTACIPLRVDVGGFVPRRDQRRCQERNRDLRVDWAARGDCPERRGLWQRYQAAVHGEPGDEGPGSLTSDGGVDGGELHARDAAGHLLAVTVVDLFPDAVSSVYCYWEPGAAQRGLGTFMALVEIAYAQATGRRWWYVGYWVEGSAKMAYKRRFGPHELLVDGVWGPPVSAPAPTESPPPPR